MLYVRKVFSNWITVRFHLKKCVKIICLCQSKQDCAQAYDNALIYELFTEANLLTICFANMPAYLAKYVDVSIYRYIYICVYIYLTDDFCNIFVHFCITQDTRRLLSRPQIV